MDNYLSGENFKDILLVPRKTVLKSRSEADISVVLGEHKFAAPVCMANMPAICNTSLCKIFDQAAWFYVYPRLDGPSSTADFMDYAEANNFNQISISIGITDEWHFALTEWRLQGYRPDFITIDVAHSHSDACGEMIDYVKKVFPEAYLIVGNGCTFDWIQWLSDKGVNCAKVGIGVSTACRTRQFTGFGSTTYSDLVSCNQINRPFCTPRKTIDIISDGGLTVDKNGDVWIGDIAKAIHAGADMVMSGALFKGCIDSPALTGGYYGNASRTAKGDNHVEGAHLKVDTNGLTTLQMMKLIQESLRSSVSYAGGTKLADIRECQAQLLN